MLTPWQIMGEPPSLTLAFVMMAYSGCYLILVVWMSKRLSVRLAYAYLRLQARTKPNLKPREALSEFEIEFLMAGIGLYILGLGASLFYHTYPLAALGRELGHDFVVNMLFVLYAVTLAFGLYFVAPVCHTIYRLCHQPR